MIPEPLPDTAFAVGMAAKVPETETPPKHPEGSAGEANQRRGEYLWVPSCAPYRLLRRAASLPETFSLIGSDPFPVAVLPSGGLAVRIKMEPLKGLHDDAEMEDMRAALDGWTADALDAVASKCLVSGRRGGVEVSHADVLRARGIAERKSGEEWGGRRGGWEKSQVLHARRALLQVASFNLRTQGRDGRTGEDMPDGFSRAFGFEDIGGGRYRAKMGKAILHFLGGSKGSDQLEMLDRRILALRPRQDEVAKRLARHLSDMWRIRADEEKKGSMNGPWNVGKLLCAIGIEADGALKPKRSLDSFRCALRTLGEVGVVGEVAYEFVEPTRRKGWTDEWLRSNVTVAPPPAIAATYRRMFETGEPPLAVVKGGSKEGSKAKLGDRVRQRREDAGWRQRQLAELMGVPQPTVARLENGRRVRLSDEQKTALKEWLEGGAS